MPEPTKCPNCGDPGHVYCSLSSSVSDLDPNSPEKKLLNAIFGIPRKNIYLNVDFAELELRAQVAETLELEDNALQRLLARMDVVHFNAGSYDDAVPACGVYEDSSTIVDAKKLVTCTSCLDSEEFEWAR